jgi:hypothetical protein
LGEHIKVIMYQVIGGTYQGNHVSGYWGNLSR